MVLGYLWGFADWLDLEMLDDLDVWGLERCISI